MVELLTIFSLVIIFISLYFSTIFLLLYFKNKKHIYDEPQVPKKLPRVSVLTPVFNEEKTIASTLESIIALHYPKDLLEVIVINDGSTDGTRAIAERYAQHYNYIKVLNKTNSGKADSLNQGIKIAKGEFFVVLDADSYIHPEAIYKSIGFFSDAKVAAVTFSIYPRNSLKFIEKLQFIEYIFASWLRVLFQYINMIYVTHGVGSIYRTDIIKEIGCFDAKSITEDMEITWRIHKNNYVIKSVVSILNSTEVPSTFKGWWNQRIRWMLGLVQSLIKYRCSFIKLQPNRLDRVIYPFILISYFLLFSGLLLLIYSFLNQLYSATIFLYYQIIIGQPLFFYFDFFISGFTALVIGLLLLSVMFMYISFRVFHLNLKKYYLYFTPYLFIYSVFIAFAAITSIYKLAKGDIRWFK